VSSSILSADPRSPHRLAPLQRTNPKVSPRRPSTLEATRASPATMPDHMCWPNSCSTVVTSGHYNRRLSLPSCAKVSVIPFRPAQWAANRSVRGGAPPRLRRMFLASRLLAYRDSSPSLNGIRYQTFVFLYAPMTASNSAMREIPTLSP